jgi:hypothetical protein
MSTDRNVRPVIQAAGAIGAPEQEAAPRRAVAQMTTARQARVDAT